MSLIEVVAAAGLLASLLVACLASVTAHIDQVARCRLRQEAIEGTDRLLHTWASEEEEIVARGRGHLPEREDLVWETRVRNTDYRSQLRIDVVRLEVRQAAGDPEDHPLVALDLFVPAGEDAVALGREGG